MELDPALLNGSTVMQKWNVAPPPPPPPHGMNEETPPELGDPPGAPLPL